MTDLFDRLVARARGPVGRASLVSRPVGLEEEVTLAAPAPAPTVPTPSPATPVAPPPPAAAPAATADARPLASGEPLATIAVPRGRPTPETPPTPRTRPAASAPQPVAARPHPTLDEPLPAVEGAWRPAGEVKEVREPREVHEVHQIREVTEHLVETTVGIPAEASPGLARAGPPVVSPPPVVVRARPAPVPTPAPALETGPASTPPSVHIHIGRLDVRPDSEVPTSVPAPAPAATAPVLTLSDYLHDSEGARG